MHCTHVLAHNVSRTIRHGPSNQGLLFCHSPRTVPFREADARQTNPKSCKYALLHDNYVRHHTRFCAYRTRTQPGMIYSTEVHTAVQQHSPTLSSQQVHIGLVYPKNARSCCLAVFMSSIPSFAGVPCSAHLAQQRGAQEIPAAQRGLVAGRRGRGRAWKKTPRSIRSTRRKRTAPPTTHGLHADRTEAGRGVRQNMHEICGSNKTCQIKGRGSVWKQTFLRGEER